MIIRNAKMNDINQIIPLMLQVSEMHYSERKDIFKEKGVEKIKLELKGALENNENILVAEENNNIVGVVIFKIKNVREHINFERLEFKEEDYHKIPEPWIKALFMRIISEYTTELSTAI
mgnify:CR=1 FL=1